MTKDADNARQCKAVAEQLRKLAKENHDQCRREMLLRMADKYEHLAARYEKADEERYDGVFSSSDRY
jgi:hypothetical protein